MEATEYPIEHFELVTKIARQLKALSIQILVHEYHYESFGSWWFTFRRLGEKYRLLFDGKDSVLRLEVKTGATKNQGVFLTKWEDVASEAIAIQSSPTVDQVLALIQRIAV